MKKHFETNPQLPLALRYNANPMMDHPTSLTGGHQLARNAVFNLIGEVMPMIVAIVSIPFLIHGMSIDRFGILTLAWTAVAYFSFLDMGISRATIKYVAEYLAGGKHNALAPLVWTSIFILLSFGLLGGLLIIILTPWLIANVLNIPAQLMRETAKAFYLLGASIPFVLATAGVRGVLEAQQRFGLVNAIKIPANILNYVVPLLVLPFSSSLHLIVAVLLASRVLVFLVYLYYCLNSVPGLNRPHAPTVHQAKELLYFGGWLTVSNAISPIMTYMDRFVIGAMLSMSAVAYYATAYELITRLWVIPVSLVGVLFPAMSAYAVVQKDKLVSLQERTIKYILLIFTPIIMITIALAEPFLKLWVGAEFAVHSTPVLQLLSIGVLINSMGGVPYSAIHALGRPDLTAKFHLVELPIYLLMLFFSIQMMGITGVALAWVLRIAIDTALWFWLIHFLLPAPKPSHLLSRLALIGGMGFVLLIAYLLSILPNNFVKVGLLLLTLLPLAALAWRHILDSSEKMLIRKLIFNS
jgi:O-antigen/teichoic acid export membrane protein